VVDSFEHVFIKCEKFFDCLRNISFRKRTLSLYGVKSFCIMTEMEDLS